MHKSLPKPVDFWVANYYALADADLCNGYKGGIYSRTKDGTMQGPNRKISTIENTNNWNSSMWSSTH